MTRVTIYSIAADCGVSPATVSRALSRPDLVSAKVRDRILTRSRELGYRPNHLARGLATGRHGTIGLMLPDITNPVFPPFVQAVQHAAGLTDVSVVLVDSGGRPGMESSLVARIREQADGFIIASPRARGGILVEATGGVPTVMVNRRVRGLPSVVCDYGPALKDAGEHLFGHGHRHVALVRGPAAAWGGQQRAEAIRTWADGAAVVCTDVGPYPPTETGGQEAVAAVLESGATVAFAYDDRVAWGMLAELRQRGVGVPEDFSVVGCNDVMLASAVTPRLTTVAPPVRALGRAAVELLTRHMVGDPVDDVMLSADLVIRESTAPAAA